ncbi:hypothetical protein ACIQUO_07895 [Streptomyces albogriseolus]|uniref:hypothetical protein n=1 Tax=Streptomyces albogriseolus TaxID=1887 RepID=UPI00345F446A
MNGYAETGGDLRERVVPAQVDQTDVTSQGRATAITVDARGHVEDADGADALIPPGEDPVS